MSVIHDLGYRHYDGPRSGPRAVARALFVDSLRAAFGIGRTTKAKIMPAFLLTAMLLPPVIISIVIATADLDHLPGDYTNYVLKTQALVGLFVAAAAPASVSRDLRFRVVALYFSRPLRRIEYVTAKYAALASAAFLLMAIPLAVMYAGALLAKLPVDEQTPNFLRSLGGAAITAVLVAGFAVTIAAMTPRRGVGVAAIIVSLTVLTGVSNSVRAVGEENGAESTAAYAGLVSPFNLAHGVQHAVLGGPYTFDYPPPGATGGLIFTMVALALAVGCFGLLLARYRRVTI
jgi:ABC-2 type transport system permease protein